MDRYQPSDYLGWSGMQDHLVVVFVLSGRAVAIMHLYVEAEGQELGEILVLDMLAVDQGMQGQGIGPGLVLFADQVARHVSIREIRLEALTPKLVRFYEKHDYARVGDAVSYEGWGEVFPMRKYV